MPKLTVYCTDDLKQRAAALENYSRPCQLALGYAVEHGEDALTQALRNGQGRGVLQAVPVPPELVEAAARLVELADRLDQTRQHQEQAQREATARLASFEQQLRMVGLVLFVTLAVSVMALAGVRSCGTA